MTDRIPQNRLKNTARALIKEPRYRKAQAIIVVRFVVTALVALPILAGCDSIKGFLGIDQTETTSPPNAPTELVAMVSDDVVELSWTDKSRNEKVFKIARKREGSAVFSAIGSAGVDVTVYRDNVTNLCETLQYRVCASNQNGNSNWSNIVEVTVSSCDETSGDPPADPTVLSASVLSDVDILLEWSDNAVNESAYEVQRKDPDQADFAHIATLSSETVTYLDTGLQPGTGYSYRVRAKNEFGESGWSNEITAETGVRPAAPANLSVVVGSDTDIELYWEDNANNESKFQICRKSALSMAFEEITQLEADSVNYIDTSLSPGTTYSYQLRAVNEYGASAWSNIAEATTPVGIGTPVWKFTSDVGLWASPAIGDDNVIYSATSEGEVFAIDSDGKQLWMFNASAKIYSGPSIGSDGTVYFGCDDAYIYALSVDGSEKWRFLADGAIFMTPAISSDGTIYFGSGGGFIYALSPYGSIKWSHETGEPAKSAAISATGKVFYISSQSIQALDSNGNPLWSRDMSDVSSGLSGRVAISNDGTIYAVTSSPDELIALNPDGTEKWTFYISDSWNASGPVIDEHGGIYVTSPSGYLYSVYPDGAARWHFQSGSTGVTPAIGRNGTIFLSGGNAALVAVDQFGFEKWRWIAGFVADNKLAVCPDGSVLAVEYVLAGPDSLCLFRTSATGPAQSSWSMYGANSQRTGRVVAFGTNVAPEPPSAISATPVSDNAIQIKWLDESTNETFFEIYRSLDENSAFSQAGVVDADITSFVDSPLNQNTKYYYRVRAANSAGNSWWSRSTSSMTGAEQTTEITVTLATPTLYSVDFSHFDGTLQKPSDQVTITASVVGGAESYQWYLDAEELVGMTSSTCVVDSADLELGTHMLSVRVSKDNVAYSATVRIKVQN